jgi:hypothetical protein
MLYCHNNSSLAQDNRLKSAITEHAKEFEIPEQQLVQFYEQLFRDLAIKQKGHGQEKVKKASARGK